MSERTNQHVFFAVRVRADAQELFTTPGSTAIMPLPPLVRLLPYIVFVILIATLYYLFPSFAYANSPAPGANYSRTVNTPDRGKAVCTSPQYAASTPYTADFIVQNKGWEYKCKNDAEGGIGSWQWCSQRSEEHTSELQSQP